MSEDRESFRIAFDGTPWESPPHSMRRVLSLLVDATQEAGWSCEIWTRAQLQPEFAGLAHTVRQGPNAWRASKATVLWCPGLADMMTSLPVVSTIHDINPILPDGRPWFARLWRGLRFRAMVQASCRRSWRVVTDTGFARDSVEGAFPSLRGRMSVVPLYADRRIRRMGNAELNATLAALELDPGYILFVGSLRKHKNWDGLLHAYAAMPAPLRGAHRLVLAGPAHRTHRDARDLANALGVGDRLTVLGTVRDADMSALYSGAALLAFPSFMEGFGLPPLEAMACGVPVVATNRTSVPEVLGDAALYADPADSSAIAGAMRSVLENPSLAANMARRGLARAATYSPAHTADAMRPTLQAALAEKTLRGG